MSTSLTSILSNATSGLGAVQSDLAVVGNNVANANTAGFTTKTQQQDAFWAGDTVDGVRTGLVTRSVDAALQASTWSASSRVSQLTVRQQTLQAVEATQGSPTSGTSLSDAVNALQAAFTTLQTDPSSQTGQQSVVAAAQGLAGAITSTAGAITAQRNSAQAQIVSDVQQLNAAMSTVETTTKQIMAGTAAGTSTADLQDQRDTALSTISSLLHVTTSEQPNGDISILGTNGFQIPLDAQFSTQAATLTPASTYSGSGGSIPPIMMTTGHGSVPPVDVTAQLSGGQLGELVQMRDSTLPGYAAQLDSFSANLAGTFQAQGLTLFTDGTGAAPAASYTGLSSVIQVNPAVVANPAAVRDGTAGTPYAPNPAGGPASYPALIGRVIASSFSATATAPSIGAQAQSFTATIANDTAQAGSDLTTATQFQTTVSTKLANQSGVNVDQELGLMIQLQNSYQANARVIQTVQQMFDALNAATTDVNA